MSTKTVDWIKEPWFHGAFQVFLPGQKKNYLYAASIPEYNNRVFFAGEHASTKNAWIQGALQSGMNAANDLVYYSVIHKYQK
jgi:monoamine oxidase